MAAQSDSSYEGKKNAPLGPPVSMSVKKRVRCVKISLSISAFFLIFFILAPGIWNRANIDGRNNRNQ